MRSFLVRILASALGFYLVASLVGGFRIDATWQSYLTAGFIFSLFNLLVLPVVKLLMLPINLLTLGLLRWLANVLVLYVFSLTYSGVHISAYDFPGFTSNLLALPPTHLSLFWVLVIVSLLMSITTGIITSLLRGE